MSKFVETRGVLVLVICGFGLACKTGRDISDSPSDAGNGGRISTDAHGDAPAGSAGDHGSGGAGQAGVAASGGAPGGAGGTGGASGSGGASGTGGATGTGGAGGTGGVFGTGGMSPSGGAGGGAPSCQVNATQCSTDGLQTCGTNGQWGMAVPCGPNQACGGAVGSAKCTCASTCTVGVPECTSSTSLGSCAAGPNSCNVQSTAACGSGLVCERFAPASCADPSWAEWPVPPSISPTGYTDNGDDTVTDRATGLMWEKTGAITSMTQPAAVMYCATTVRTGGHSDWRLPSKIELLSIVDYGESNLPSMNAIFGGIISGYWSSTPFAGTSNAWYVSFGYGASVSYDMTGLFFVRCVR